MACQRPALNCPYCMTMRLTPTEVKGLVEVGRLFNQWSQAGEQIYWCVRHGLIILHLDGHLWQDRPDEPVIRN